MALLTTFRSACDLAHRLPGLLASFMELESALARRFREDSISDLIIASFLQISGLPVVILTPEESRTGSDFDLEIIDPASGTSIRYRIQAKRLGPPTAKWQTRSYKELAHPLGTGLQVKALCDLTSLAGPVPTIPLYVFYNPEKVCTASGLAGITLADAFEIEAVVGHALSAKPRPPFKRISSLMPLFFELHEILCPPSGESSRLIATPQESKDAYERVRETRRQSASAVFKGRPAPEPGPILPEHLAALRQRDTQRFRTASVTRPRIVVASSDPDYDPAVS